MQGIVNMLAINVNTFAIDKCKFVDMQPLTKRAKLARTREKLTQQAAADLIGCTRGTVAMWESDGAKTISGEYLLPAAKVYRVRPNWLADGSGDDGWPWLAAEEFRESELVVGSDIISAHSSRLPGQGSPAISSRPEIVRFRILPSYITSGGAHTMDLPRGLLDDQPPLLGPDIHVAVNSSDAMRGEIERGDLVFVDASVTLSPPEVEGIFACSLGTTPYIKRIRSLGDGGYRLQGSKPTQDAIDMYDKTLKSLTVYGLVVGVLPKVRRI